MKNQPAITRLALAVGFSLTMANAGWAAEHSSDSQTPITIQSASEMPVIQIPLNGLPSKLVLQTEQELSALNQAFAQHISILDSDYVLADTAARRTLLKSKLLLAMKAHQWQAAITLATEMKALEEKPAAKEVAGLLEMAFANAAIKAGNIDSEQFRQAFAAALENQLTQVDMAIAKEELQSLLGFKKMMTTNFIAGFIQSIYDEQAQMADMKITTDVAQQLLSANRVVQQELPVMDVIVNGLETHLAAAPEMMVENRWKARSIAVDHGEPTLVAIWDSGFDVALQSDRLWANPDKNAVNPNGLAFAEDFSPERDNLMTRMQPYADELAKLQSLFKGFSDQRDNVQSQEAQQFQQHVATLTPDEIGQLQKIFGELVVFNHGQVVADIAASGITPIELMNIKFSFPSEYLKSDTQVDENYVDSLVVTAEKAIEFMQKHRVRVVNMSWIYSLPMMEQSLLSTGVETDVAKAKKRAKVMFERLHTGLTQAFASAPDILFIAAAGNEDENLEFAQAAPAGINLPNVITIGAVDASLQPTSFTSFGSSIDFYANGFRVPGRMPGGIELAATGTSMAAPLVTNVVAKMLAVEPSLTPQQVVAVLKEHATLEGEKQLPVVHPSSSVCSLASELQGCSKDELARQD